MSEKYQRPEGFPNWVNSNEDERLVGAAEGYGASERVLNSKFSCEEFVSIRRNLTAPQAAVKEELREILSQEMAKQLSGLKSHRRKPLISIRTANETSTAVTPAEPDLMIAGQGVVGLMSEPASNTAAGALKDVKIYFELLRDHIAYFGGEAFDVTISGDRRGCVIRHVVFAHRSEVRFPYTSFHVKNHWVSFRDNVRTTQALETMSEDTSSGPKRTRSPQGRKAKKLQKQ